jgi:Zn-dependent peptidase ImmA (M78 family)
MPRKHQAYPYVEVGSTGITDQELTDMVTDMVSQNPQYDAKHTGTMDLLCQQTNVDIEYSDVPNEILLEKPLDSRAVIWLPKKGKIRQDRLAAATGIGHWLIHVPPTQKKHPNCGMQALYQPTDPAASQEAYRFALTLLMPEAEFKSLWYEGRAKLVADTMNVPTLSVYDRAKMLRIDQDENHSDDSSSMQFVDPLGILGPKKQATVSNSLQ